MTRRNLLLGSAATTAALWTQRASAAPLRDLGTELFHLVQDYSRWPSHQTATSGGVASTKWLASKLRAEGAEVQLKSYGFRRYLWHADVRIAGRRVDSIPYFYEGVGRVASTDPFVRGVRILGGVDTREVDAALAEAKEDGAALAVLATSNLVPGSPEYPALVAINSSPERTTTGVPTLLIHGDELEAAEAGPVTAKLDARVVDDRADIIVAKFGPSVIDPIVIGTPISGWFSCGAERGPGIAIAFRLAKELSAVHPVLLVGTSGHELKDLGVEAYLHHAPGLTPRAVFHLGASIAAGIPGPDGELTFAPYRGVSRNLSPELDVQVLSALADMRLLPVPTHNGEGKLWHEAFPETRLLSFAGAFPQFHTPDDLPSFTTNPDLLARAYRAIRAAADLVVN